MSICPLPHNHHKVIDRARIDWMEGNLWRARDRLQGAVSGRDPLHFLLLECLGEVHWAMGDKPKAGAAWYATQQDDDRAICAWEALRESCGNKAINIAQALPPLTAEEFWPASARERLSALLIEAEANGYMRPQPKSFENNGSDIEVTNKEQAMEALGCLFIAVVTVGPWLLGLVYAVILIWP